MLHTQGYKVALPVGEVNQVGKKGRKEGRKGWNGRRREWEGNGVKEGKEKREGKKVKEKRKGRERKGKREDLEIKLKDGSMGKEIKFVATFYTPVHTCNKKTKRCVCMYLVAT